MTKRNKWRIVSLAGVAFCAYAYYLGADDVSDAGETAGSGEMSGSGETSGNLYRLREPGGEWVVSVPCPAGYRGRGEAQWTQEVSRPLVWWVAVESGNGDFTACCSCTSFFDSRFDARFGKMVQPFYDPEALARHIANRVGKALGVSELEVEDARYVDTDKYDALLARTISLIRPERRGEVRLRYCGWKGEREVSVTFVASFMFAGRISGNDFTENSLRLSLIRSSACPVGREREGEGLATRLVEGLKLNPTLEKRLERMAYERTMADNQQSTAFTQQTIRNLNHQHEMGQRANAALNAQQEMFQAAHERQQQSQDHWANRWRDVIGEKQSVVDPQSGNPVRVDRAENTYFDPSGRPVQMSDDQLRDWSRRNGGGAVGARERFEYANPQLRRATPAQDE